MMWHLAMTINKRWFHRRHVSGAAHLHQTKDLRHELRRQLQRAVNRQKLLARVLFNGTTNTTSNRTGQTMSNSHHKNINNNNCGSLPLVNCLQSKDEKNKVQTDEKYTLSSRVNQHVRVPAQDTKNSLRSYIVWQRIVTVSSASSASLSRCCFRGCLHCWLNQNVLIKYFNFKYKCENTYTYISECDLSAPIYYIISAAVICLHPIYTRNGFSVYKFASCLLPVVCEALFLPLPACAGDKCYLNYSYLPFLLLL